jgi:Met-zincin/Domain of unknown function (DUF5117)/Domain of unknown function (DUF5118)
MKLTLRVCGVLLLLFALGFVPAVRAQDETTPPAGGRGGQGGRGGAAQAQEPRPYDQVIHADFKTQHGVFDVHQNKDQYFYEIPTNELDKDFLWVTLLSKTTIGVGYGGTVAGNHVVRWERHGNRVLLRSVSYEVVADDSLPIATAVQASNNDSILMSFPIEAFGKNDAPVIDVSRLYNTEVPEFSARTLLRARGFDAQRSFIDRITAYPENIEVEATQTYTNPPETPAAGRGETPAPGRGGRGPAGMRGNTATVVMHFSMVKLPENKMMPRLFDDRVGYFNISQEDYGTDEHRAARRTYITRWRLEKKDPNAAISEPVKPIVYYVDPATPMKWRPYVKKAILDWQPAFEAAGFKNAILAKDAPTKEEDPNWSAEDIRNSVIRWLPSTTENAVGPNIHDPRTGEILNADIELYHNVMNLASDWYFIQVGPLDPRASKLPLPDELMGRLIEYVLAHEIGHTLGFQHNMKSSSLYPFDKIRDPQWLHKMGHVATLMDYSRFNYVAQPEDHIPPEDLIPRVGPYDIWATHWGYAPIPGAKTSEEEKVTLDKWSREQDQTPWLRFSTDHADGTDPGENTEAVGDADAIQATTYGMKNLDRVMKNLLIPGTTADELAPYDRLSELYGRILGQWTLEMGHVAVIVGGIESQDKHPDQSGPEFWPESRERQIAAVQYLNKNAFQTPTFLINAKLVELFEPQGEMARIRNAQVSVLNRLLQDQRIDRLIEIQALDPAKAYAPSAFITDVRQGIWSELAAPSVSIDAYRRNLQDAYIEDLGQKINERTAGMEEVRALLRADLKTLSNEVSAAIPKAKDAETRAHLEMAKDEIARVLDPKFALTAETTATAGGGRGGIGTFFDVDPESLGCWPDYQITATGVIDHQY